MKWQVRQPERQRGFLGTRENASHAQYAQKQAEHRTDRKQPMRDHACATQIDETQHSDDQPASDDQQHVMDDQQVFHRRCLRCCQMSCSTASLSEEGYTETGSIWWWCSIFLTYRYRSTPIDVVMASARA